DPVATAPGTVSCPPSTEPLGAVTCVGVTITHSHCGNTHGIIVAGFTRKKLGFEKGRRITFHWEGRMKRLISGLLALVLLLEVITIAAVRGDKAMYVGGTVAKIEQKTHGRLDLSDEKVLVFTPEKGNRWELPYNQVTILEYGQKVGRRVGASIATALLVSPVGLFMLFSKKRKHYLSIGWKDESGKEQGA